MPARVTRTSEKDYGFRHSNDAEGSARWGARRGSARRSAFLTCAGQHLKVAGRSRRPAPFAGGASVTQCRTTCCGSRNVNDAGPERRRRRNEARARRVRRPQPVGRAVRAASARSARTRSTSCCRPGAPVRTSPWRPIFARGGSMMTRQQASDRIAEIVKRWPNVFSTCPRRRPMPSRRRNAERAAQRRHDRNRVAVVHAAEQSASNWAAARRALKAAKYEAGLRRSYPMSTQNLTP